MKVTHKHLAETERMARKVIADAMEADPLASRLGKLLLVTSPEHELAMVERIRELEALALEGRRVLIGPAAYQRMQVHCELNGLTMAGLIDALTQDLGGRGCLE